MTVTLTTFRASDGLWHANYAGDALALCGDVLVPGFKPGRKRPPTCAQCVRAARELPVAETPEFWGWWSAPASVKVPGAVADPPVRDDGRCARPGCNKLRHPELSRRYAKEAAERDPFCSTECCKAFHGVKAIAGDDDSSQARVARKEHEADLLLEDVA